MRVVDTVRCRVAAVTLVIAFASGAATAEEASTVRLAQQFGLPFLPLTVMKEKKLLESAAAAAGVPGLAVTWAQFANGTVMNEALISNNLDVASGGIGPMITAWSKTRRNLQIRGVAALGSQPLLLNTINSAVKTIADLSAADKIAVPAVKVSIQAVTLQMAAERLWGEGQYAKLDGLTVSMTHPDGTIALLGGRSEITAHFSNSPYQYQQLEDPRVRTILNSYEVTGGPHTSYVVWTTKKFHDANPRLYKALLAALDDANRFIREHPEEAASIYIAFERSTLKPDFVQRLVADPDNLYTTTPQNIMKYALFMNRVGQIAEKPDQWSDMFFPELSARGGS